ncbi:MAG: glycosyltransferase [Chitinophagaceae bacterium]|nr:MAG: glycosyltransferase [Chitinophagaceae bacterium]
MKIVIDASHPHLDLKDSPAAIYYKTLKLITEQEKEHDFLFLVDEKLQEENSTSVNFTFENTQRKSHLLGKIWWDFKLAIRGNKRFDILVSFEKKCFFVKASSQCFIATDANKIRKNHFQKMKTVVVDSFFFKNVLTRQFKIDTEKIEVVPVSPNSNFTSIDVLQKNVVKEKYSDGKEFFLYIGNFTGEESLIFLLKAFSQFKKRQQSNFQILIINNQKSYFENKLTNYKYRGDVKWFSNCDQSEELLITATAYALLHPFSKNFNYLPVLKAMQSAIPVIAVENSSAQEMATEAGLYFENETPANLSEKMMLLYTNENLRNELAEKAINIAATKSIKQTVDLLWQAIKKTVD